MIPFVKMQGNGNDFIVLDNRDVRFSSDDLFSMARTYCRRRSSLGADGILVVENSQEADFTMRLFNADGSEGEMCGNGARCIARYAFEKKIAGNEQSFSTLAGIMKAVVTPPFVDLDMGTVPLSSGWFNRPLSVGARSFDTSFLVVGVPHLVLFLEEDALTREETIETGRELCHTYALFPNGTNVNFVVPNDDTHIASVTYERGVEDLTDSCGTGSTASAIAWVLRNAAVPSGTVVEVKNPGGVNFVTLSFDHSSEFVAASLKGRALMVAEGALFEN
ncbi:MAG TPA: diaminopimelate epimerase [Synergistales bacterium]|nr:diaminopimelate epimerase [Synergistaceae bacterium]HOO86474.1 diaminopimelate epimerase [Synergistales bacterium]HPE65463.1 diaminopimelate epimerase [Synergistales bacterium]